MKGKFAIKRRIGNYKDGWAAWRAHPRLRGLGLRREKLMLYSLALLTFGSEQKGKCIRITAVRTLTWLGKHCWSPGGRGHDTDIPQSPLRSPPPSGSPETRQSGKKGKWQQWLLGAGRMDKVRLLSQQSAVFIPTSFKGMINCHPPRWQWVGWSVVHPPPRRDGLACCHSGPCWHARTEFRLFCSLFREEAALSDTVTVWQRPREKCVLYFYVSTMSIQW